MIFFFRPKLRKKKKPSTTFRKNNNTNKIKNKPTTNVKSKLQQIKLRKLRRQKLRAKIMKQLQTMDDKNKILRKNAGGSSPNRRIFNNSDLSLSRKDFLRELTTWFRRSIWFLIFAGAYTTSPTLLGLAVSTMFVYMYILFQIVTARNKNLNQRSRSRQSDMRISRQN